jgi:hypothetical protein
VHRGSSDQDRLCPAKKEEPKPLGSGPPPLDPATLPSFVAGPPPLYPAKPPKPKAQRPGWVKA